MTEHDAKALAERLDEAVQVIDGALPGSLLVVMQDIRDAAAALRSAPVVNDDLRTRMVALLQQGVAGSIEDMADAVLALAASPATDRDDERAVPVGKEWTEASVNAARLVVQAWQDAYEIEARDDVLADLRFRIGASIRSAVRLAIASESRHTQAEPEKPSEDEREALARIIDPEAFAPDQWQSVLARDQKIALRKAETILQAGFHRTEKPQKLHEFHRKEGL